MHCFHHCTLDLPRRVVPIACLSHDEVLLGVLLDHTPEFARERFRASEPGLVVDDEAPFRIFLEELHRYASGEEVRWRSPVRFETGTEFQRKIWQSIDRIPFGETITYASLAKEVGAPGGARAAGGACGRNPIPLRIPCHRVVASGGGLGGFTGVLETKRALLRHEGVAAASEGPLFP